MHSISSLLNGTAVGSADSTATSPVFDPATGVQTAELHNANAALVDKAVQSASQAAPAWGDLATAKRASLFFRLHQILDANRDSIARAISAEHGKTHGDALGEVSRGIEVVEFACGLTKQTAGTFSPQAATGIDVYDFRQPLGVVAGITPFNFPFMVPMWMAPMALACGNAFILKPSERDPSASLLLHQYFMEAGFPPEVLQVIHGGKEAVDALLTHEQIAAVSFVGSTAIARYIYETATAHGKRVQALGGAKNHMVVLPDADLEAAANALMGAAFGSAGERCMAISVAVPVGKETADKLVALLKEKIHALKIAPATDETAEMGPLITAEAQKRVLDFISTGEEEGAEVVCDGRGFTPPAGCEQGFFVGGTLLDKVTPAMRVWQEEIFGPVLSVVRADSAEEALAVVNQHPYGNGTALFTRNGEAARSFVRGVKAGMVGINVPIPVPVSWHSFGGWKSSLFGANAIYGTEGLNFYSKLKTVTARWHSAESKDAAQFHFPTLA